MTAGWRSRPRTTATGARWPRLAGSRRAAATTPRSPTRSGPGPARGRRSRRCGCCSGPGWPPGRCRTPRTWCATPSTANGTSCWRWIIPISAWPSTPAPPYRLTKTPAVVAAADPAPRGAHGRDPHRVAGHAAGGSAVRLAEAIVTRRAAVSRTRPQREVIVPYENVKVERIEHVSVIRMNRPEVLNALNAGTGPGPQRRLRRD